jgi:hypothetical protein
MGVAELDIQNRHLFIIANIFFYGDAANETISKAVAMDIQQHWNEPNATVIIKSNRYKVIFNINGKYAPNLQPVDIFENDNSSHNYFRIEAYSNIDISFVDGIGSNTGYFKLANLLNNSTTAAHEFGHTLGLIHPPNLDIRGAGIPGIMYPRGTIVDPAFQYDPAAAPAAIGGTLNPVFRKVVQQDMDDLRLHKLYFNQYNQAVVGAFSSVWHDKH